MEAGIEAAGETIQTNLFFQTVGKKHTFLFQIFKGSLRDDDVSPASDKLWWMDLFVSVVQENLLLEYDKICKMYYFLLLVFCSLLITEFIQFNKSMNIFIRASQRKSVVSPNQFAKCLSLATEWPKDIQSRNA